MAEALSLAKQLNAMHGLAAALAFAGILGSLKRDAAEVDRMASDLIELSTRHLFAQWLAIERFFAVGPAVLAVMPRKVSRGSSAE